MNGRRYLSWHCYYFIIPCCRHCCCRSGLLYMCIVFLRNQCGPAGIPCHAMPHCCNGQTKLSIVYPVAFFIIYFDKSSKICLACLVGRMIDWPQRHLAGNKVGFGWLASWEVEEEVSMYGCGFVLPVGHWVISLSIKHIKY